MKLLRTSAALVLSLTLIPTIPLAWASRSLMHTDASTGPEIRRFLARLAITPDAACAAGVTAEQVPSLFEAAGQVLDTMQDALTAADTGVSGARSGLAITRAVAARLPSEEAEAAVVQATAQLQTALAQQATAQNTAFEAACVGLPATVKARLVLIRQNADQSVPIKYRTVTRTEAQWKELTEALHHLQTCQNSGKTPQQGQQAIVENANSDSVVAAAATRMTQAFAGIKTVWQAQSSVPLP